MIIYGRDARIGPRSLKHLFSGSYRNPEANRLSGVYELSLRRASEAGSPGRMLIEWLRPTQQISRKSFLKTARALPLVARETT